MVSSKWSEVSIYLLLCLLLYLLYSYTNQSHERSIYGSVSSSEGVATLQTRGNPGGRQQQQQLQVRPPDFDAVVNASAVAAAILGELRWREAGLDVEH